MAALTAALLHEENLGPNFARLGEDGTPQHFITDFAIVGKARQRRLDSLGKQVGPMFVKGTCIAFDWDHMEAEEAVQRSATVRSARVNVGPVQEWAIEWSTDEPARTWIRSRTGWFLLLEPTESYAYMYQPVIDRLHVTTQFRHAVMAHPKDSLTDLASKDLIDLEALGNDAVFVHTHVQDMVQMPPPVCASPALAQLEPLVKAWSPKAATLQKRLRLTGRNMAILSDARRSQEQTLSFFARHWPAVEPFVAGMASKTAKALADVVATVDPAADPPTGNLHMFSEQPDYVKFGEMRGYQLRGLSWMASLYDMGLSGCILADEMGLGKTLQSISFLGFLHHIRKVSGPHLVLAPLSTLPNWMNEFERWVPSLRVVKFHGPKVEREAMKAEALLTGNFDVCVTNYESFNSDMRFLRSFVWRCVMLDEAHRIKNEKTVQTKAVMGLRRQFTLLITGTPLQNNMHELWVLLHFMFPKVFASSVRFDDCFDLTRNVVDTDALSRAHALLDPIFLRRVKADVELSLPKKTEVKVYVPLTKLQSQCYRMLLTGEPVSSMPTTAVDPDALLQKKSFSALMSMLTQLRKCCNHPYLFPDVEPDPDVTGEDLVTASGKMVVLDKLLPKLQRQGNRVLLYSQWTSTLNILEDYMVMRGYEYVRLDGSTHTITRSLSISRFNEPKSDIFVFLLSTRAGGLGINLATADTVILYDSDWNPQVDLQAQDRAHRIGQTKDVTVYRLVCAGTVEERIVDRASQKMYMDAMVVKRAYQTQQMRRSSSGMADAPKAMGAAELMDMIRFGAQSIFRSGGTDVTDEDIDALLTRSEAYSKATEVGDEEGREALLREYDGSEYNVDSYDPLAHMPEKLSVFEGEDHESALKKRRSSSIADEWVNLGPRKRRSRLMQVDGGHGLGQVNVLVDLVRADRDAASPRAKPTSRRKRVWVHKDTCFRCHGTMSGCAASQAVKCPLCPNAFHARCLGLKRKPPAFPPWRCPWHSCVDCDCTAAEGGGVLFRCETCPRAWCNQCRPHDGVQYCERSPMYEALKYAPKTALYTRCSQCGGLPSLMTMEEGEQEAADQAGVKQSPGRRSSRQRKKA